MFVGLRRRRKGEKALKRGVYPKGVEEAQNHLFSFNAIYECPVSPLAVRGMFIATKARPN